MKAFFARIRTSLTKNGAGRKAIQVIHFLRLDLFIFSILDHFEPSYSVTDAEYSKKLLKENKGSVRSVYDNLGDELSRKTYEACLKYRCTRKKSVLRAVRRPEKEQYFAPDIIDLSGSESFVDCGAFTGDTIEAFIKKTGGGGYKAIYAFEPSSATFIQLEKYIQRRGLKNVYAFHLGTYRKKDILTFDEAENDIKGGNKITTETDKDQQTVKINVDALDNILRDKEVTFIKMDIEGAEMDSLYGAQNIIKKQKPVLAICIYHSTKDMFEIPAYIHSLVAEYRLYVRHYSSSWGETVLYAIPQAPAVSAISDTGIPDRHS